MLIYLIGYMGSGKTTIGKKLAKKLNYQFVDMDNMIETKYKIEVGELFQKYDEDTFRKIEHQTLNLTFQLSDTVIATGGGTPCFYNNIDSINKNGVSIYLEMSNSSLAHRLIQSKKPRPLVEGKSDDELISYINEHLEKRRPFYSKSKISIKGENLCLNSLIEKIEEWKTLTEHNKN